MSGVTTAEAPLLLNLLADMREVPNQPPKVKHRLSLLELIYSHPGITRKDLIGETNIRPGTVSDITGELIAQGLIEESAPSGVRERGRPEVPLKPVWTRWVAISVYCVSMEMRADLISAEDVVIASESRDMPATADNAEVETILVDLLRDVIGNVPEHSQLLGATLSIAGLVNAENLDWIFSARWPRIRHLSLARVRDTLGIPLHLQRQLDLQLEYAMLANPDLRVGNTLLFHWGYGIGGAFASNGTVIQSSTGVFCQIGHVSVFPKSTRPCICGRIGCLEADAALWALAPHIEGSYGNVPQNEDELVQFLKDHPVHEEPYFKHALGAVGHGLSHLLGILVPNRVLVYGPFLESQHVFETLHQDVRRLSPPIVADETEIEVIHRSSLSDGTAGTVWLFRDAYRSELMEGVG